MMLICRPWAGQERGRRKEAPCPAFLDGVDIVFPGEIATWGDLEAKP